MTDAFSLVAVVRLDRTRASLRWSRRSTASEAPTSIPPAASKHDPLVGHQTAVRSKLGASTSYHCYVNPIVASVEDAILIATQVHRGQRYPSPGDEPYIFHPLRVMMEFREPVDQMAAVLHEAVEDTDLTLGDLAEAGFPDDVIVAVDTLTTKRVSPMTTTSSGSP